MDVGVPLNLTNNEIVNVRLQNLPVAPANAGIGAVYYDTTIASPKILTPTGWMDFGGMLRSILAQTGSPLTISIVNGVATLGIADATQTVRGTMTSSDKVKLDGATSVATGNTIAMRDAAGNASVNQLNAKIVTGLSAPLSGSDAATKAYVDAAVQGIDTKANIRLATDVNVAVLSGLQILDTIQTSANNRVLLMGQTNAIQNGIWVVQAGNWTRPTDFASGMSAKSDYCFIQEGSRFRDCGFICIVDGGSDTIDTHNLVWSKFASAGELLFGKGGTKTGNVLDVVSKNGAIRVNDDDIEFVFDPAFFVLDPAKGFQLKDGGVSLAKIGTDVFDGVTIAPIAAGRPFGVKNYTPIASATITRSQQFSGNVGLGTPLIIPNPFGVMSVATEIYNSGTGAKILLDVISNLTSITISANCTPAMAIRGIIQG